MSIPAFTDLDIEYGRFTDLDRRFGIKRSTAYLLLAEGKIKSRIVRHAGSLTGTRLIDFNSVREFLTRAPLKPTKGVSQEMSRRGSTRKKADA